MSVCNSKNRQKKKKKLQHLKAEQTNVPKYTGDMKKTCTGASTNYNLLKKSTCSSNLIEYFKEGPPRRLMVSHQLANKVKTAFE